MYRNLTKTKIYKSGILCKQLLIFRWYCENIVRDFSLLWNSLSYLFFSSQTVSHLLWKRRLWSVNIHSSCEFLLPSSQNQLSSAKRATVFFNSSFFFFFSLVLTLSLAAIKQSQKMLTSPEHVLQMSQGTTKFIALLGKSCGKIIYCFT